MHNTIIEWYERKPDQEEGSFYRTPIRPGVAKFAIEMEAVLQENDHKSGWKSMDYDTVFRRIRDEFKELTEAYNRVESPHMDREDLNHIQDMRKEAIDIANFCMFLCHNYPKDV